MTAAPVDPAPLDSAPVDPARPPTPFVGLTKRTTFLALVVPTLILLLGATRTWVVGRSSDPLLGGATLEVSGSQAAPGVVALGAVALAGTIALLTAGPRLRRVSAVLLAVAALGASVLTLLVVVDPAAAVSALVAERVGQSGRVATDAGVTFWVWPELAVGVVLSAVGLLAIPASGRWEGLSSRFERPDAAATD
ncbi:MAG: Trp biosynthesis-associated membrane protein, partial [Lapillicoccus sp.]